MPRVSSRRGGALKRKSTSQENESDVRAKKQSIRTQRVALGDISNRVKSKSASSATDAKVQIQSNVRFISALVETDH